MATPDAYDPIRLHPGEVLLLKGSTHKSLTVPATVIV